MSWSSFDFRNHRWVLIGFDERESDIDVESQADLGLHKLDESIILTCNKIHEVQTSNHPRFVHECAHYWSHLNCYNCKCTPSWPCTWSPVHTGHHIWIFWRCDIRQMRTRPGYMQPQSRWPALNSTGRIWIGALAACVVEFAWIQTAQSPIFRTG